MDPTMLDFLDKQSAPETKEYTKLIRKYTSEYVLGSKEVYDYNTKEGRQEIVLNFLSFVAVNAEYYLNCNRDKQVKRLIKDFLACAFISFMDTSVLKFKQKVILECLAQMRAIFGMPSITTHLKEQYLSMLKKLAKNDRK